MTPTMRNKNVISIAGSANIKFTDKCMLVCDTQMKYETKFLVQGMSLVSLFIDVRSGPFISKSSIILELYQQI